MLVSSANQFCVQNRPQQSTIEMAWDLVLRNELSSVRQLLDGQEESRNGNVEFAMLYAILNCLEADLEKAEEQFYDVCTAFEAAGNQEGIIAVHLYLAYLYRLSSAPPLSHHHLSVALNRGKSFQIDLLKRWWHPAIMLAVFAEAARVESHAEYARLLFAESSSYHKNAAEEAIGSVRSDEAGHRHKGFEFANVALALSTSRGLDAPKRVLNELLHTGLLNREEFDRLAEKLTQRQEIGLAGTTLLATFGLYVQMKSKTEIAQALGCSVHTVSTCITTIYRAFNLRPGDFSNHTARRCKLVELAHDEHFINRQ